MLALMKLSRCKRNLIKWPWSNSSTLDKLKLFHHFSVIVWLRPISQSVLTFWSTLHSRRKTSKLNSSFWARYLLFRTWSWMERKRAPWKMESLFGWPKSTRWPIKYSVPMMKPRLWPHITEEYWNSCARKLLRNGRSYSNWEKRLVSLIANSNMKLKPSELRLSKRWSSLCLLSCAFLMIWTRFRNSLKKLLNWKLALRIWALVTQSAKNVRTIVKELKLSKFCLTS